MKSSILVFIASLLLGISATSAEKNKPTLSKRPLTAEEVEVYGTFLDPFVGKGKEPVNFSDKTFPLTLLDSSRVLGYIHAFEVSISSGRAIKLVDERKHKIKDPGYPASLRCLQIQFLLWFHVWLWRNYGVREGGQQVEAVEPSLSLWIA